MALKVELKLSESEAKVKLHRVNLSESEAKVKLHRVNLSESEAKVKLKLLVYQLNYDCV